MRLGGPFPFNQAGSFPISMGPGAYAYVPPGNWLLTLGQQSVLQWWDPINYNWRNLAPAGCPTIAISVDGYNYRLINLSGVVQGAAITNAGSGGTNGIGPTQTGVAVTIAAPGGTGQTAKAYAIVGGSLPALSISNAGSGFVVPPQILIDPPPPGGIQATATCTITAAGLLNSVALVNVGAGYTSLPNVYVVPQFLDYPGAPAMPYTIPTAPTPIAPNAPLGNIFNMPPQNWSYGVQPAFPVTGGALVNFGAGVLGGSGTLTGIVITDYGSAYNTSVPAISFAGGGLAGGVAATALMSWAVQSATQTAGTGFVVGEAIQTSMGYFFSGTTAQRFFNNDMLQPRMMTGVLTNTNGTFSIEDPGFGMQTVLTSPNFGVQYNAAAAPTVAATYTVVMGGVNDTSILQAMVNE